MPEIPVFQRRPIDIASRSVGREVIDVSPVAQGLAISSQVIAQRHERLRRADQQMAEIKLDRELSEMRVNTTTFQGRSAMGLTESLENTRSDMADKTLGDIQDPITRQNMTAYFEKSFNNQVTWTKAYELKQEDDYLKEVDEVNRQHKMQQLNVISIGDTASMDAAATELTIDALAVQGEKRMSSELQDLYYRSVINQIYAEQIQRWYREAPDLAYKWFDEHKEMLKEKLSPAVFNSLLDLHDREYDAAETFRIYKEASAVYGRNSLAGALALMNPNNYEKFGIQDYRHAKAVSSMLRGNYNMNKALDAAQALARLDVTSKQLNEWTAKIAGMANVDKRNQSYRSLIQAIRTDPDMTIKDRNTWIANITKGNFETDPLMVGYVKDDIDNGIITTNAEIRAHVGDGVGLDTGSLEQYLAKKQALEAKGESVDYIKSSIQVFSDASVEGATAGDRRNPDKIVLRKKDRDFFARRLRAEVRAEGWSHNDPRIVERAAKLMGKKYYDTEKGKEAEITEEQYNEFFRLGEYSRYAFQNEPTTDVQTAMEQVSQEGTTEGQTPKEKATQGMTDRITQFAAYRRQPHLIPVNTPTDKALWMENEFYELMGRAMTEAEKQMMYGEVGYAPGEITTY